MIWDVLTLMWRHCSVRLKADQNKLRTSRAVCPVDRYHFKDIIEVVRKLLVLRMKYPS